MSHDLDRRRGPLSRAASWPGLVVGGGTALAVAMTVFLAKPMTITVGDVDIDGPLFSVLPISVRVLSSDPSDVLLDWFCDWSYGVGDSLKYVNGRGVTTQAQHLDECFGNVNGGAFFPFPELKVVAKDSSAAPSGWPDEMQNLLRVAFSNTFSGSPMVWSDSIIEPDDIDVGDAVFVRGYFSDESEVGASINAHPFHYGYGGNGQLCPDFGTDSGETASGTSAAGQPVLTVSSAAGFGTNQGLRVGDHDDVGYTIQSIDGNDITFYTNLVYEASTGETIYTLGNCYSLFFHWDNESTEEGGFIPNPNVYLMEGLNSAGAGQGNFAIGWSGERLETHHVYRFEQRFYRSHSDSVEISVRIYDETSGGSLKYDESAWGCSSGGCFDAGGYAGGGSPIYLGDRRLGMKDMRRLAAIEIGNNGSEAMDPPTPQNIYWGGLAVRLSADSSAWIGPYPVGPEVN